MISGRATATAKTCDGPAEMARMLKLAKDSAVKSRTQAINQLKAVLVSADAGLRDSLAGLSTPILLRRCAELARPMPSTVPIPPASPATPWRCWPTASTGWPRRSAS